MNTADLTWQEEQGKEGVPNIHLRLERCEKMQEGQKRLKRAKFEISLLWNMARWHPEGNKGFPKQPWDNWYEFMADGD